MLRRAVRALIPCQFKTFVKKIGILVFLNVLETINRANSTDILGWEFQFPLILKFNKRLYFNLSFILVIYMSFFLQINFNFSVFFLLELAEENDQNSLLNIFSYDLRVESLLKVKI